MKRTAIILAGGMGTRLREVVKDVPKPMALVNGRPFLEYLFRYLKKFEVEHVIISTGYLSESIRDHFRNEFEGLKISYSHETEPMGTGGGIRLALQDCKEKEFFVLNGDSFFDVNLNELQKIHNANHSKITLALREVEDASRYGRVKLNENGEIIQFLEKSTEKISGAINAGVYLIDKEYFLSETPAKTPFSIEKDLFMQKAGKKEMFAMKASGYFIDIGIPEDYSRAQNEFKEFKY